MAAYFLPSYFQKRLLRYALSRLDFIDSTALDLDNLGFTIGQRSVIELRNVGIKVSKLLDRVDLPSNFQPKHASIRVLRITIPADLHVSGIEVEVDRINFVVETDQTKPPEDKRQTGTGKGAGRVPSHKDIANRPRIASTTLHDPGGNRSLRSHADPESLHFIPAPEDLAASFLEAEPEQGRQELQAAVASRSLHLQQSYSTLESSTSVSDHGMGNPEGFSLPGFVTNFFAGIADRLSISIKNVTVRLSIPITNGSSIPDPQEFVLEVDSVELPGADAGSGVPADTNLRRHIRILGVRFYAVIDDDFLSQKSSTNSPELSKSRSTVSTSSNLSTKQDPHARGLNSSSSSSSASYDDAHLELGIHESMLEESQLFESTLDRSHGVSSIGVVHSSRSSPGSSHDDINPPTSFSQRSHSSDSIPDDLAQSTVFSHHEAESMFMSAMSHVNSPSTRMPGGFNHFEDTSMSATPRQSATGPRTPRAIARSTESTALPPVSRSSTVFPVANMAPPRQALTRSTEPLRSEQCTKRLFYIDEMTLRAPAKQTIPQDKEYMQSSSYETTRGTAGRTLSTHASHARIPSDQSVYEIPKEQSVKFEEDKSYQIAVGNIDLSIDMSLCHILLKSASHLSSTLKSSDNGGQSSSTKKPVDTQLHLSVGSLVLNVMENVPHDQGLVEQHAPTESTFSVFEAEASLLQLQLLKVQMYMATRGGVPDQKLTVNRLGLYKGQDKIISFFDASNLQESVLAPSVLLEPDDLVYRQLGNRVDITTKPLRIKLDLLMLDEVLSRSGGLSSLLDLGNSVASASTMKEQKPSTTSKLTRRRSVYFDDPMNRARPSDEDDKGLKLNIRISASIFDLVGSQSSLQIKSSAIKLVYRPARLRTNISSVSIRGPIVHRTVTTDILNLKLGDLKLHHIESPEEEDLDRLLQLLAPSSKRQGQDDDIMVDTLLRQRRKGSVLRLSVQDVQATADGVVWIQRLSRLGDEISKLSSVTKYLPEDDRPGILIFGLVSKLTARVEVDRQFGPLLLKGNLLEGALISVPSLMAAQISSITLNRDQKESLIRELIPNIQESTIMGSPMLLCRFIPDEMEPTIKLQLSNACFEYSVPLSLAFTQLVEALKAEFEINPNASSPRASEVSSRSIEAPELARKIKLSLALNSSAISLRPLDSPACGIFLFSDAVISHSARHNTTLANIEIRKASIMIVDDVARIGKEDSGLDSRLYFDRSGQVQELIKSGFVPVGSISAASADVKITEERLSKKQFVDVEFRNSLLFLETCADSTQTLTQILSNLMAPTPPSKAEKYRTEVVPVEDMLASWTGNVFVAEQGPELGLQVDEGDTTPTPSTILAPEAQSELNQVLNDDSIDEDEEENFQNDLYVDQSTYLEQDEMSESSVMSESTHSSVGGGSVHIARVNVSASAEPPVSNITVNSLIDFRAGHFVQNSSVGGTAHRWNSPQNTYGMGSEASVRQSPVKVRIRDVHIIWNLFDGYDWQNTRDAITQAVREVEDKALAKQRRRDIHRSPALDEDDESVVGDVLFNSIYISIPTNRDPRDLANAINMDVGDVASETGSYATSTTITAATSKRHSGTRPRQKKLKLSRSRSHKITFELEGLAADFITFPPGSGEVESSVDIRVNNVVVFDHVPTSTWKKFATYDYEAGEREVGTDMVHVELLNVKPVADLAASEMVVKITVLPLRLHVDQDALDFMTRFFEFKDDRIAPSGTPSNPPFIQRAEVNPIKLRLDFKPKRVDYAGLKSGKLTEFMNFIILERSDMVLRRVILYGVSGFDRLGIMLNNIWTPDVRNNQLPGVLAGLAPVRSLVDVGVGVRDLIAVPIREYKKDGRIVRSIQKGAIAFAKTTTTELVNLGAKLAIGTQTVLQSAEGALVPQPKQHLAHTSDSEEEEHQISHYADQPLGIIQGLRGAYASLERDLLLAKDAIVAVPGEIMAEGSATGAAKVMLKQSPTIVLRPAIGVSKAMGQALLGAGNTLDKGKRRRMEDKYKRY
ncbi:autophagy- protein 2 [Lithohypha guttulata]|nr:autophagy- protein 2 [Lithohypha guttulata]